MFWFRMARWPLLALLALSGMGLSLMASDSAETVRTRIVIGGGYADTFDGVIAAALARAADRLKIVVLPVTYSSNAERISDDERRLNLEDAESRRAQLADACAEAAGERPCEVVVAPVFTRADADDPANSDLFGDDLTAVYILGGDQTTAMQALADTRLERTLAAAYDRGVIFAGTSAGLSIQARAMIGGYSGDAGRETGLNRGAVDLWNRDNRRGLSFGLTNALLEQHFWERGRLPRLLNALAAPDVPHVGLGVDGYTAVRITNDRDLAAVFGLYTAAVLDAESAGAAKNAAFSPSGVLSLRRVWFHLLAPATFTYDLDRRTVNGQPTPRVIRRDFAALTPPQGAGPLLLAGGLAGTPEAVNPALARFVALNGGPAAAQVLLIAAGGSELALIETYSGLLQAAGLGQDAVRAAYLQGNEVLPPLDQAGIDFDAYTGVMVVGDDASAFPALDAAARLAPARAAWLAGKPLLLDGAAAALAGSFYAAHPPAPLESDDDSAVEAAVQGSFIQGATDIQPGLGLLDLTLEPNLEAGLRWGRWIALAYAHPDRLALGLNEGAALEITADGAAALGADGLYVLDLRGAALALGQNDAYAFANGLLDVFAPGDSLIP